MFHLVGEMITKIIAIIIIPNLVGEMITITIIIIGIIKIIIILILTTKTISTIDHIILISIIKYIIAVMIIIIQMCLLIKMAGKIIRSNLVLTKKIHSKKEIKVINLIERKEIGLMNGKMIKIEMK